MVTRRARFARPGRLAGFARASCLLAGAPIQTKRSEALRARDDELTIVGALDPKQASKQTTFRTFVPFPSNFPSSLNVIKHPRAIIFPPALVVHQELLQRVFPINPHSYVRGCSFGGWLQAGRNNKQTGCTRGAPPPQWANCQNASLLAQCGYKAQNYSETAKAKS